MKKYQALMLLAGFLLSACTSRVDSESLENILIYKSSGRIQCDETQGLTVRQTAQQLAEVEVIAQSSSCGVIRGMAMAAVCGQSTLDINVHKIPYLDWAKVKPLGFSKVADLKSGYQTVDCAN